LAIEAAISSGDDPCLIATLVWTGAVAVTGAVTGALTGAVTGAVTGALTEAV